MSILETEIRMRCIEQAVLICARRQNHDVKEIIATAEELCNYVNIGSSPTEKTNGGVAGSRSTGGKKK